MVTRLRTERSGLHILTEARDILVVCFLLSDSPASEFYMPTFRNTLSVPSS